MDGSIDSVADSLIMGNESEENPTDEDLLDQPEEESNEAGPEDDGEDLDDTADDESDDQDEDEAEEAEDAGQQELYTVKVDGEEREVTLEDLKRSYSGQAYISKGMNEAAQQKKEDKAVEAMERASVICEAMRNAKIAKLVLVTASCRSGAEAYQANAIAVRALDKIADLLSEIK